MPTEYTKWLSRPRLEDGFVLLRLDSCISSGQNIFGLTIYLLYLMPIIWIGNSILVFVFKHFNLQKKKNFFLTLGIGAVTKTSLLFGVTFLLVSFAIVPSNFLIAMGTLQLFTALTGGVLAFTVQRIKRKC